LAAAAGESLRQLDPENPAGEQIRPADPNRAELEVGEIQIENSGIEEGVQLRVFHGECQDRRRRE